MAAVVCAALLCGGAVAWGPSSAAGAQDLPQEAAARLQQVTESVALNEEGSQVRFTLPELEEGEDWRVQISGRYVAADQVSMSVHLDTPGVWEPGRSYEIPIKPRLRQAEGGILHPTDPPHISGPRGGQLGRGGGPAGPGVTAPGRRERLALAGGGVSYPVRPVRRPGPPCDRTEDRPYRHRHPGSGGDAGAGRRLRHGGSGGLGWGGRTG